jgi:uncharacterized protein (DUF1778 family)
MLVSTLSGRYDGASFSEKGPAMTAVVHSKSERIDVRASAPVKQLLQEAARVAHKNVSEFLLDAGIIAANQTLADRTRFELSAEQWLAFQTALDQPVGAKPKLEKLLSEPGLLG